ncbi:MAG: ABC transporter permease [Deltaproteobacteria bacterium]|jgi:putative ABC transport system permease protein|nr:ABC transporter permease [Deltaproteobacteria bacterium]
MSLFEHLSIAFDSIRNSPVRTFLTTLGVLIGVFAVILLVGLGDAVQTYVLDTFAGVGSNLLQVHAGRQETRGFQPSSGNSRNKLSLRDYEALDKRGLLLDGVSPVVLGSSELRLGDLRRNVVVFGVGPRYLELRNLAIGRGRFLEPEDLDGRRRVVVIGETIVGELFGDDKSPLGATVYLGSTPYRVVGVTQKKGKTFGFDMDDLALIPATSAQDLFDIETITHLLARAKDKNTVEPAIEEVGELLADRRGGTIDFTIYSQDDMMEMVNRIMGTLKFFLGAIASISLLVGGIGIMNIMLVSVKERTREIGVRRAVGARWRDILLQFLVEAVVVSVLGGLAGVALGAVVIRIVAHFQPDLPVGLSLENVVMALGFSAAVGIAAGVVPAMRAADLDPVEALRYE